MRTLSENVAQAITDFDSIKTALVQKGQSVPAGTPTSAYAVMILAIEGAGGGDPTPKAKILVGTGSQYINTEIGPTNATKIELKVQVTADKDYTGIFGSRISSSSGCFYGRGNASGELRHYFSTDSAGVKTGSDIILASSPCVIVKDGANNTLDGVSFGTNSSSTAFASTYPLYIFGANYAGILNYPVSMRLWHCKIWQGETLERDFIPVGTGDVIEGMTAPSNCLYDAVSKSFFINAGSGVFGIEDE